MTTATLLVNDRPYGPPAVQRFISQVYRINDVLGWAERNELVLSPSFQRRRVWSRQGKSYLIDSIVRGMPIPQPPPLEGFSVVIAQLNGCSYSDHVQSIHKYAA